MDRLDIAILRELSQAQVMLPARIGLGPSYRDIARIMKVAPGTIRNRIKALYESGVLLGSSVFFNPTLANLEGGAFAVDIPATQLKNEVVQRFKEIEGVSTIHNFYGSLLGFAFLYEKASLQRKLELFRATACVGSGEGYFSHVPYPACTSCPSASEWAIIKRLSSSDYGTYADLAKDLGMKVRSLKDRMARILRSRTVLSIPTLNYRAIAPGVTADIVVWYADADRPAVEAVVLDMVGHHMIFAGIGEQYVVYNLVLPKLALVEELEQRITSIPGVERARAELVREHIDLTRNLAKLIPHSAA